MSHKLSNHVRSFLEMEMSPEIEKFAAQSLGRMTDEQLRHRVTQNLITLRHPVPHVLGKSVGNQNAVWDITSMLSCPDQLLIARDIMSRLLRERRWRFNSVVGLSAPATPIATLLASDPKLAQQSKMTLHHFDNYTLRISPDRFEESQRIILVDTLVRSGWHLSTAIEYLSAIGGEIVGVVVLCLGAKVIEDINDMPRVSELLEKKQLIYVYSWRQLFALARKQDAMSSLAE